MKPAASVRGVDYATMDQGTKPDLVAATAWGCRFALVRGEYGLSTDATARRDCDAIRASGMIYGEYFLGVPARGPAADQVRHWQKSSPLRPGDFPPVFDVEFPGGVARTGMDRPALIRWVVDGVAAIRDAFGCRPMIYTSRRVWDGEDADSLDADRLGGAAALSLTDCPLWLARYPLKSGQPAIGDDPGERPIAAGYPWPPAPAAWGIDNLWIHQYQGDAQRPHGFRQADMNRFKLCAAGETGPRVRWLQRKLQQLEGNPGVFDAVTAEAVRAFQRAQGLLDDGIVGPATFARLCWA